MKLKNLLNGMIGQVGTAVVLFLVAAANAQYPFAALPTAPIPNVSLSFDPRLLPTKPGCSVVEAKITIAGKTVPFNFQLYLPPGYPKLVGFEGGLVPVVVSLHNRSSIGNADDGMLGESLQHLLTIEPWDPRFTGEKPEHLVPLQHVAPMICIAPHCPGGYTWESAGLAQAVGLLIDAVVPAVHADPDRVCLTGFSYGASSTWVIGQQIPERLAAIAPCDGRRSDNPAVAAEKLKHVAIYLTVGDNDGDFTNDARTMFAGFAAAAHPNLVYKEWHGGNHFCYCSTYSDPIFWTWLQGQKRAPLEVRGPTPPPPPPPLPPQTVAAAVVSPLASKPAPSVPLKAPPPAPPKPLAATPPKSPPAAPILSVAVAPLKPSPAALPKLPVIASSKFLPVSPSNPSAVASLKPSSAASPKPMAVVPSKPLPTHVIIAAANWPAKPGYFAIEGTALIGNQMRPFSASIFLPQIFAAQPNNLPIVVSLQNHGTAANHPGPPRPGLATLLHSPPTARPATPLPTLNLPTDARFIALIPHNPSGTDWDTPGSADALNDLIQQTIEHYKANPKCVSLTGIGSGGTAAWSLATALPNRFAAIAVLDATSPPDLKTTTTAIPDTGVYLAVSDNDAPLLSDAQRMRQALTTEAHHDFVWAPIPAGAHAISETLYQDPRFWTWMLSHHRT